MASPLHPGTHAAAFMYASTLVSSPAVNCCPQIDSNIDLPGVIYDYGDVNIFVGWERNVSGSLVYGNSA